MQLCNTIKIKSLRFLNRKEDMKLKAFTLAETLITIGIIGIVAAISIPGLIQNYKLHVLRTSFLKSVSIIQNAISLSMEEYGIDSLEGMSKEDFNTYFLPVLLSHLKVSHTYTSPNNKNSTRYKKMNFSNTTLFNTCLNSINEKSYVLLSGMTICFIQSGSIGSYGNLGWVVDFDVNGEGKPNRGGFDVWELQIKQNAQPYHAKKGMNYCSLEPSSYEDDWYDTGGGYTHQSNGRYCAYYAMSNKCPNGSHKEYFKCLPK